MMIEYWSKYSQYSSNVIDPFEAELKGKRVVGWRGWISAKWAKWDEPGMGQVEVFMSDPYISDSLSEGHTLKGKYVSLTTPEVVIEDLLLSRVPDLAVGQEVILNGTLESVRFPTASLYGLTIYLSAADIAFSPVEHLSTADIPKDLSIRLEQSGSCWGTCPHYSILLDADGTVVYEGTRNVKTPGPVKAKISVDKVREVVTILERAGYFAGGFKSQYITMDGITVSVYLVANGKSMNSSHDWSEPDVPRALYIFEQKILEVVNPYQWIR
jgi:hypothetical protein